MSEPIKKFLSSFLNHTDDWKLRLIKQWTTIFGDLSNHVSCEKIEDTIITLGVYDSCWLQELYMLSPTLLHAINTHLTPHKVLHIRFKKISRKTRPSHPVDTQHMPHIPPKILSSAERITLERITDIELRSALKNFLLRCHTIQHM